MDEHTVRSMTGSLLDLIDSPPAPLAVPALADAEPAPYLSSRDHLEDALKLVALLLERHLGRFGHRVLEPQTDLDALRMELRDVASHGTPTPLLHCALHVPDDVVLYLMGLRGQAAGWGSPFHSFQPHTEALALDDVVASEAAVERLRSALRWVSSHTPADRVVLQGPKGIGRRTLLRSLLAEIGTDLVVVDLDELALGAWYAALGESRAEDQRALASLMARQDGAGTAFDPDEPVEFRLHPDPLVLKRFASDADLMDLLLELSTAGPDDLLRRPEGWRATVVVQSMFEGAVKIGIKTTWADA